MKLSIKAPPQLSGRLLWRKNRLATTEVSLIGSPLFTPAKDINA
jgi:hypothetical protein